MSDSATDPKGGAGTGVSVRTAIAVAIRHDSHRASFD
ncbi:hypothetical protein MGSAQ_001102 [marine sediment metagenome]|uniref:Uncharacterized protein n=1 Tax=marine sediment metagenome TaxID=412755 RepID=A0A1B6NWQ3_9ZZZZ